MKKEITKDGKTLVYEIKYKRIKNVYFRNKEEGLIISAPLRTKESFILNVLNENFEKFYERQLIYGRNYPFKLWGKKYEVVFIPSNRFSYKIDGEVCFIYDKEYNFETKKKIFKKELEEYLSQTEETLKKVLGEQNIYLRKYNLKYLKSKFGSYNRVKDEITLNIFLSYLDPVYLYYVLIHEYAHTKVFNHSIKFYDLVYKLMPDYKKTHKAIKKMVIPSKL